MKKRNMVVAVIVALTLSLFAFTGCEGFNLTEYKESAKATIQTYALEKGLNNEYTKENWVIIESIVAQGESAVDAAKNKPAVDTAEMTAKLAMDGVPTEVEGIFYSLDYAYDNGWLTIEQLQSIAYYYYEECIFHDHGKCETFVPIPKNPLILSNGTLTAIKQTYLGKLQIREENATLDNIQIVNYLGTYNDCIIVGVTDNCFLYDYLFEPERTIGEVLFRSYCANFIQVWKVKRS